MQYLNKKKKPRINTDNWVDQHASILFKYAISRVYNSELAEDLVQDTFLSALKNIQNFKGISQERTWLIAILKNKLIDHYKKKSTQNEIVLKENYNDYDDKDSFFETQINKRGTWNNEAKPNVWETKNSTPIDSKDFMNVLSNCLSKLPPKWSGIFSLKNMEDMDVKQICKEFKITQSNYWVIIHRSKLELRECMEKNWFNP